MSTQNELDEKNQFDTLNEMSYVVYEVAKSKGWHSEAEPDLPKFMMNLHTEISELWEAERENRLHSPCDKAEKMQELCGESLDCFSEELADILIRILDTAKAFNIDIARAVRIKNAYNKTRPWRHGGKSA